MTKSPPRLATSISTRPRTMSSKATTPVADAEAEGRPAALGLARGALVGGQVGAAPDVARRLLGRLLAPSGRRRAPRACSSRDRPGPRRAAARRPRRRAAGAASGGTARTGRAPPRRRPRGPRPSRGPSQCRPSRMSFSNAIELRACVGVLEPQDERAARVAGVQVVEQRRPGGPDVERAGRARRDPDADGRRAGQSAGAGRARGDGTWWNSAGSASPGRTRTSAAGRRPSVARPRGPVERQRVERLASGRGS